MKLRSVTTAALLMTTTACGPSEEQFRADQATCINQYLPTEGTSKLKDVRRAVDACLDKKAADPIIAILDHSEEEIAEWVNAVDDQSNALRCYRSHTQADVQSLCQPSFEPEPRQ